jgi:hypothetical protein
MAFAHGLKLLKMGLSIYFLKCWRAFHTDFTRWACIIRLARELSGGIIMKKVLVATVVALSLGTGSAAFADTTATPSPKATINQQYKAALDKWRADSQAAQAAFKAAMADYLAKAKAGHTAREAANGAFKSAVKAAQDAYKSAIKASTTAEAKTAADNARKAAIAAATAARDAAIKAIAALPAKPAKPTLPVKPVKPTA